MAVHPDKNRDGRANEAFIAVENSASILTDKQSSKEYDQQMREYYQQRRQHIMRVANNSLDLML